MEQRPVGQSPLRVSALGLGCMSLSGIYGAADDAASIDLVQHALDRGINHIDSSDMYGWGHNETLLGRALRGRRDRVMLATKFGQTRNPVLLARSQRVMDVGPAAAARVPSSAELASEAVTMVERPVERTLRSSVLSGAQGTAQRLERALEVLVWEAAGARGFLYLVQDGRLALAAPFHGDEPATEITEELVRRAAQSPHPEGGALELPGGKGQWLPVLMQVYREGAERVVAAAAIIKGALPLRPVPAPLCTQLGEELWQAGDATAMR